MRLATLLLSCIVLTTGCAGEDHQDIKAWMQEQASDMRGRVPRLPEIKPFPPVAYEAELMLSPFVVAKIVTVDALADKTAPDRSRPLQPLESFPLEDLRVVGVILSGSQPYALVQTPPPNKPKNVRIGEYMGQSFGKVVAIGKEGVTVRETIRDINGVWVEQEKTLSVPREGGS